ncbi:hypothetical protein [Capnocytophaga felis]|uniref:Uncharacterized protein n=1 Tax=Capnocytophaga felis TaxID=2267611 RepID=A0A5M4B5S1_9FLAO|nr:hypothetical protein [Capnocytophaga felis]GET44953.1 hypothetical protein RCZ01_02550 [Capnocytophaga felis]GET47884.1 hypothetical protein RCZ02_07150 [Capnocytophaga felis]
MGEYREKATEKIISTIQNVSLIGLKSETLQTEYIAGFPPYLRGYHAMGNLLQLPEYKSVCIWNKDLIFCKEKYSEILFHDVENLLNAENIAKRSIIITENSNLNQIIDNINQINYIYLLCNSEYLFLQSFFQQISKEILPKIRFVSFFDEKVFERMNEIRKMRSFWSEIMEKMKYSYKIPIASYVHTVTEQLYALAVQSDVLLYDVDNLCLNDELNGFLIENSLVSKTIDPFWK